MESIVKDLGDKNVSSFIIKLIIRSDPISKIA